MIEHVLQKLSVLVLYRLSIELNCFFELLQVGWNKINKFEYIKQYACAC